MGRMVLLRVPASAFVQVSGVKPFRPVPNGVALWRVVPVRSLDVL